MREQDMSKFATLIVGMGEVYGKPFTSEVIDIYWNLLKNYKYEDVKTAIYRHLENPDVGKYLPKPSDIIMAIEGNSYDQALRAWSKVAAAMRNVGSYSSVAFDDALIHAVISDMGGWQKLCCTEIKQFPFSAKEFQERYRGYIARKPAGHPKYLIGIIESQNNVYGYLYGSPVLVGDKTKAKEVVSTGIQIGSLANQLFLSEKVNQSISKN